MPSSLIQTPSSSGNGVEAALRFDDLHRRLRLLGCVKNRASMLHLLHALSDTGTAARRHGTGVAKMPPRIFSEPSGGLSGVDHVGPIENSPAIVDGASSHGHDLNRHTDRTKHVPRRAERYRARGTTEVTERSLLRGILYAFQVRKLYLPCCACSSIK